MKTENTRADRILDLLGWILLIGTLVYLILGWPSFPDQIPMHYNGAGEIDRWGGKGEIIFIEVMMWILYLGIGVVEKYPQIWNTGVEVTAKNKEKVYRTLKYMLKTLKFLTECSASGMVYSCSYDPCIRGYGILADPSVQDKEIEEMIRKPSLAPHSYKCGAGLS